MVLTTIATKDSTTVMAHTLRIKGGMWLRCDMAEHKSGIQGNIVCQNRVQAVCCAQLCARAVTTMITGAEDNQTQCCKQNTRTSPDYQHASIMRAESEKRPESGLARNLALVTTFTVTNCSVSQHPKKTIVFSKK